MADKVIPAPLHEIATIPESVSGIGQQQQIEILFRVDKRLHYQQGVARMNIIIKQTVSKK